MGYRSVKVITATLFIATAVVLCMTAEAKVALHGRALLAPRVEYLKPDNDSVVDLTGRDKLVFSWREVPIPAGGREAYRFTLFKGFTYKVVVSRDIDGRTFSVEVPAEKFEDGETYTWRVKQRDARTLVWSLYDTWSFKVIKK